MKFADQFGRLHRFSLGMNRIPANDTGLKMTRKNFDSERIERRSNSRDLIQDFNTVSILFNHALNAGDLAGDPIGSAPYTFLCADLHLDTYTGYMYIAKGFIQAVTFEILRHAILNWPCAGRQFPATAPAMEQASLHVLHTRP